MELCVRCGKEGTKETFKKDKRRLLGFSHVHKNCKKAAELLSAPQERKPLQPINITFKGRKSFPVPDRDLKRAVIWPDSQHGFSRDLRTGALNPFHDRIAINAALQVTAAALPDRVVLLGDMIDLPAWSDKFIRSPEMYWTTQPALLELSYDIGRIRNVVGEECTIDYIPGNHEKRLETMIYTHLMEAATLRPAGEPNDAPPALSLERLLGLRSLGVTMQREYPYGEVWINPDLKCIHGDICRSIEGGTARAILQHTRCSVIFGHVHRIECLHTTHRGLDGEFTYLACCPGTLALINGSVPAATANVNWQNGIGIIDYNDTLFHITVVPIHNGIAIWDGKLFTGKFGRDERGELCEATKWEF